MGSLLARSDWQFYYLIQLGHFVHICRDNSQFWPFCLLPMSTEMALTCLSYKVNPRREDMSVVFNEFIALLEASHEEVALMITL